MDRSVTVVLAGELAERVVPPLALVEREGLPVLEVRFSCEGEDGARDGLKDSFLTSLDATPPCLSLPVSPVRILLILLAFWKNEIFSEGSTSAGEKDVNAGAALVWVSGAKGLRNSGLPGESDEGLIAETGAYVEPVGVDGEFGPGSEGLDVASWRMREKRLRGGSAAVDIVTAILVRKIRLSDAIKRSRRKNATYAGG